MTDDLTDAPRKPRLAFMGEFSAGKSTLTNLLLGRDPLPTKVTATRLPPVWLSHGPEAAEIIAPDGTTHAVALDDLHLYSPESAALIRMTLPSDALELCDIIDTPGISDPNMAPSVVQSILPEIDSVVWCTHATQAWRQSEAAVWQSMSHLVSGQKILLVTHFDKLLTDRDRGRVLKRLRSETDGEFDAIFPICLKDALRAEAQPELWHSSGAAAFIEYLVERLLGLEGSAPPADPQVPAAPAPTVLSAAAPSAPAATTEGHVMPKRVRTTATAPSRRPSARQPLPAAPEV